MGPMSFRYNLKWPSGFFRPGDILVLDNASIHNGGNNSVMEEWLYGTFGVLLVFLPARSPELNPIEQVWKILVNKLQRVPLSVMRSAGSHACAHAAIDILSSITHEEVEGCYKHCDYL
jgi:transposase